MIPARNRAGCRHVVYGRTAAAAVSREVADMLSRTLKILKIGGLVLGASLVTVLAVRAYDVQRGPDLQPWHTFVPDELIASSSPRRTGTPTSPPRTKRLPRCARRSPTGWNRRRGRRPIATSQGSPIYPGRFATDWNRSYVLEPAGRPLGAVVFLHGLTDSPYSLRHLARRYRDLGFVAVAPRMPAHGTVPAALTEVEWEDWSEATRLAVREARRRAGPGVPLHIVGFSNGGALAMKYALDAIGDERLEQADRVVLIAPMIGITSFARFAGVFGWPAVLPGLRQGLVARRGAGVQPVQVQLVPDQRRPAVVPADPRAAAAAGPVRARGAARTSCRPCRPSSRWWISPSARARSSRRSTRTCPPTAASSCCSTSTAARSSGC